MVRWLPARRLSSAHVVVQRPANPSIVNSVLADFGPLRLVEASTPATAVSPGDEIPLSMLWQAAPDYQPEPLVVVVQLLDEDGQVVASLEEEPLAGRYPTSAWQAGELVQDRHALVVPAGTPPGSVSTHRRPLPSSGRTDDLKHVQVHWVYEKAITTISKISSYNRDWLETMSQTSQIGSSAVLGTGKPRSNRMHTY